MANKSKSYIVPLILDNIPEFPYKIIEETYTFSDFDPLEPKFYIILNDKLGVVDDDFIRHLFERPEIDNVFNLGKKYMVVFNLDKEYHYEYLCFKRGNYSWYRPEAKNIILNYLTKNVSGRALRIVDTIRLIFLKDPLFKRHLEEILDVKMSEDAELSSKIDEERETFYSGNYEQFKEVERGAIISSK